MITLAYGFTSCITKLRSRHIANLLINNKTVWYYLTCLNKLYPFSALNDNDFHSTFPGETIKFKAFTKSYNFDHLHTLLSEINISFYVIGITETRLKKQTLRTTNIDINVYNLEHTPTEISCGGTLVYVKNKLNYISQKDLNI